MFACLIGCFLAHRCKNATLQAYHSQSPPPIPPRPQFLHHQQQQWSMREPRQGGDGAAGFLRRQSSQVSGASAQAEVPLAEEMGLASAAAEGSELRGVAQLRRWRSAQASLFPAPPPREPPHFAILKPPQALCKSAAAATSATSNPSSTLPLPEGGRAFPSTPHQIALFDPARIAPSASPPRLTVLKKQQAVAPGRLPVLAVGAAPSPTPSAVAGLPGQCMGRGSLQDLRQAQLVRRSAWEKSSSSSRPCTIAGGSPANLKRPLEGSKLG